MSHTLTLTLNDEEVRLLQKALWSHRYNEKVTERFHLRHVLDQIESQLPDGHKSTLNFGKYLKW